MHAYYLVFKMVDDRIVASDELGADDLATARLFFRRSHPRFFRDVVSTSLVSRKSGRVLNQEAI